MISECFALTYPRKSGIYAQLLTKGAELALPYFFLFDEPCSFPHHLHSSQTVMR